MGRKPNKYKTWDISDYVSCLSTLRDRFTFKVVEIYSCSEYEIEIGSKDLTLALYKFFLALEKPYIHRVKLLMFDKDNPLFPTVVADRYVYQSR